MASNADLQVFSSRRQALINLALKRNPILVRQKSLVSFVDTPLEKPSIVEKSLPIDGAINELPPFGTNISIISPSFSRTIKSTSARSISHLSSAW